MRIEKIFLFGDSFSYIHPTDDVNNYWPVLVAKHFKSELLTGSVFGCCQDFIFQKIEENKNFISANDQIIIALTDQNRFWFKEDSPDFTNVNILNFKGLLGENIGHAASEFYKYILRPSLVNQWMIYRLGWLNNLVIKRNWRCPIILSCFDHTEIDCEDFDNLIISNGFLNKVSEFEFDKDTRSINVLQDVLFGIDPRACHLCYSNHAILADKIIYSITNNKEIDLTSNFVQEIIDQDKLRDADFMKKEFSQELSAKFLKQKEVFNKDTYKNFLKKHIFWKD